MEWEDGTQAQVKRTPDDDQHYQPAPPEDRTKQPRPHCP